MIRNRTHARETLVFVFLMACLVLGLSQCGLSAEAKYTKALLNCVDNAETVAESRACRRHVDGNYGITTTNRDGGSK